MTPREVLGVTLYAMALIMIGWAYLAGIECGREMSEPRSRFIAMSEISVVWKDANGCWRASFLKGTHYEL